MSIRFDVGEISHELAALLSRPHLHELVVVVPLDPGAREIAGDLLAEGPPFDPEALGIDRHEVFLADGEAIFVFGLPQGPRTLERMLADEDFWSVVGLWERIARERPRIAEVAFRWP